MSVRVSLPLIGKKILELMVELALTMEPSATTAGDNRWRIVLTESIYESVYDVKYWLFVALCFFNCLLGVGSNGRLMN